MNDNRADDRTHIDEEWLHDRLVKLLPAQFGTLLRDDPGNRVLYFGFRVVCRRFRQHVDG